MTAWRRHLHAHPELAYEEVETARFVAEKLRSFGVDEVHEGIAKTGVVGVLRGRGPGPSIGLRADMDALPIEERPNKPWSSKVPGKMHACGHDGHTTMLLGAARHLARSRSFSGTLYLIFQPAEEGFAGARAMIEEGLFERFPMERVFGLHNWPDLPAGEFGMRVGPAMAAADRFTILLEGLGCHGAMPHQGRDPIVAAAALVQGLQSIVSREVDPIDNAVISVTRIAAGDAYNVVPDRAELWGTVRTYKPETRDAIERRLREVTDGIAAAYRTTASVRYERGYPATVNSAEEVSLSAAVAAELVGPSKVHSDHPPCMGAEDFAFMLERKPGSYVWMGQGGGAEGRVCHSPFYDFNDEVLALGASYWVRLVEHLAPPPSAGQR
ncbi:MAG: M20 aminoacylase family protein [Geminicoccaceae bacterium]|nr:M20 aminoacylase family protein [Geminicoccaceae bacterium]